MTNKFSKNHQVKMVNNFSDLINTKFQGLNNAICWHRNLTGDFQEIVSKLFLEENITEISIDDLLQLDLTTAGALAREIIINDIKQLTEFGALPSLNLLKQYERDDEFDFISTDVYSYHVDRSPIATDTFLCTYHGAASDILANEQATQKVLIPEIRAKLRTLFDGPEAEFEAFLTEYFFDLHYQAHDAA